MARFGIIYQNRALNTDLGAIIGSLRKIENVFMQLLAIVFGKLYVYKQQFGGSLVYARPVEASELGRIWKCSNTCSRENMRVTDFGFGKLCVIIRRLKRLFRFSLNACSVRHQLCVSRRLQSAIQDLETKAIRFSQIAATSFILYTMSNEECLKKFKVLRRELPTIMWLFT